MKVKEYLSQQEKMPEKDKLVTYEKIRQHMEEESIFSRLSFYVKV